MRTKSHADILCSFLSLFSVGAWLGSRIASSCTNTCRWVLESDQSPTCWSLLVNRCTWCMHSRRFCVSALFKRRGWVPCGCRTAIRTFFSSYSAHVQPFAWGMQQTRYDDMEIFFLSSFPIALPTERRL